MPDNIFKIPGGFSRENKFLKKYLNPTPVKVGKEKDLFILPEDWKKRLNSIPRDVWEKRQKQYGEEGQQDLFSLFDKTHPEYQQQIDQIKKNLSEQRKLARNWIGELHQPNIIPEAHRNPSGRILKFTPEEIEQAKSDPLLNYIIQKSSPLSGAGTEDMFLLPEGDVLSSVPESIWQQEAAYRGIPLENAKAAAGLEFRDIANRKRNELDITPEMERDTSPAAAFAFSK